MMSMDIGDVHKIITFFWIWTEWKEKLGLAWGRTRATYRYLWYKPINTGYFRP
jgi:hypothetical protein